MSNYYDTSLIGRIKASLRIEELFKKYYPGLRLAPRGNRLWVSCPFHHEKTPSFCMDMDTQRFCCYGCHVRGDVIDLFALICNLNNRTAIHCLAVELGITHNTSPEAIKAAHEAKMEREKKRALNSDLEIFVERSRFDVFDLEAWILTIRKHIRSEKDLYRPAVVWALTNHSLIEHLADLLTFGTSAEQLQASLALRRWQKSQQNSLMH